MRYLHSIRKAIWLQALLPAAVLALVACSSDNAAEPPRPEPTAPELITFSIDGEYGAPVTTRGLMVRTQDELDVQKISLTAMTNPDSQQFFDCEQLSSSGYNDEGESMWKLPSNYYWPTYKLDFYARMPYTDPQRTDELNAFVYEAPYENSKQYDQMYGLSLEREKGTTVPLNMKHALSAVSFTACTETNKISVKISGIELCNVVMKGRFAFPATSTQAPEMDESLGAIVDHSAPGTWTIDGTVTGNMQAGVDPITLSTQSVEVTTSQGAIMLIPQTLSPWLTTEASPIPLAGQTGSYLAIQCSLMYEGVYFAGSADAPGMVYVPIEGTFVAGYSYTFDLIFGLGYTSIGTKNQLKVNVTPTITGWDKENLYFEKVYI